MSFADWERWNFMTPLPVRIWRSLRLDAKAARFTRRHSKNQPPGTP